jgi:hypothetical protein
MLDRVADKRHRVTVSDTAIRVTTVNHEVDVWGHREARTADPLASCHRITLACSACP